MGAQKAPEQFVHIFLKTDRPTQVTYRNSPSELIMDAKKWLCFNIIRFFYVFSSHLQFFINYKTDAKHCKIHLYAMYQFNISKPIYTKKFKNKILNNFSKLVK